MPDHAVPTLSISASAMDLSMIVALICPKHELECAHYSYVSNGGWEVLTGHGSYRHHIWSLPRADTVVLVPPLTAPHSASAVHHGPQDPKPQKGSI